MAAANQFPEVIELNVGGKYSTVSLRTLTKYPDSKLAAMFTGKQVIDKDKDGRFFICADENVFSNVLNFLRQRTLPKPEDAVKVYALAEDLGLTEMTKVLQRSPGMIEKSLCDRMKDKITDYQVLYDKTIDKLFKNQASADIYQSPYLSTEVVISVSTKGSDEECAGDDDELPLPGVDHVCSGYGDTIADFIHDSKYDGSEEGLLNFLIYNLWKDGYCFNYNTGSSLIRCKENCRRKMLVLTFTSRDLFTTPQE